MNIPQRVVYTPLKWLGRTLCRVHDGEIAKIPERGPLIIVANHVNFLDVPLLYTHLLPRSVTGFAKVETWKNPFMGALFSLGHAIPIRRGMVDRAAISAALKELQEGRILAIAPEGTRSGNGHLQKGRSGVAMLAIESGAPVLPVVYYGGEQFRRNIIRMRRTDFHFAVGEPFFVRAPSNIPSRQLRDEVIDEIMYQLAELLPSQYRGYYSHPEQHRPRYLVPCDFLPSLKRPN